MSETAPNAINDHFQPYPNYKDNGVEWLEEIPAHWELIELRRRLRDGVDGIKIGPFGSQLKLEDMSVGGFKVYGQANIIKRDFEIGNKYISPDKYVELGAYKISPGDIVVSMMGTTGRCQVVPDDVVPGIMDSHLLRIRVDDNIDPHFLELLIDEAAYVRDQVLLAGRGTVMHGLNSSIIKSLRLAIPSLDEQHCILNFLDHKTSEIDTLIGAKERLITLLQEKRAALITHAVTKGLDPSVPIKESDVEWLGEIPTHWDVGSLSRWWQVIDCKHRTVVFEDHGRLVASIGEVHGLEVDLSSAKRTSNDEYQLMIEGERDPRIGDILYSRNATVGSAAMVTTNEKFCMGQDVSLIRSTEQNPRYLLFLLHSSTLQGQLDSLLVGSTFKRINVSKIKGFIVPVPPVQEQHAIGVFCQQEYDNIQRLIDKVASGIERLQEYRTALISSAVTGKIDVRNAT